MHVFISTVKLLATRMNKWVTRSVFALFMVVVLVLIFVLLLQLHDNAYDVGRALQALVKVINPKSADRRWSDDDAVSTVYCTVFTLFLTVAAVI